MTCDVTKFAPAVADSNPATAGASEGTEAGGTPRNETSQRSNRSEPQASDPDGESSSTPRPDPASGDETTPTPSNSDAGLDRRRQRRQSTSLVVLAVVAVLFVLYAARAILLPLVIAVILTLLLRPAMRRCRGLQIPDAVSAAIVLGVLLLLAAGGLAQLIGPAQEWVQNGPGYLRTVGEKLHFVQERVQEIQETSDEVRAIAAGNSLKDDAEPDVAGEGAGEADESLLDRTLGRITGSQEDRELADEDERDEPIPVEVRQPGLMSGLSVLSTTGEVLAGIVITIVLTYFLLATGDHLLNNVLHVLPTFRDKRNVVEMVHEVENGVSTYLVTVTLINIGLGIAVGLAMWLLGMPNPALWGTMATVLNFIPYLGAMVGTIIVFLVGVFTFDSVSYAFVVPVVYFGLTALEGNFVTPALLGRRMSLSPVVVFLALVFWSWIWGVGGALIAVPTLAMLKVGFDQFDRTRPLGTLIGG